MRSTRRTAGRAMPLPIRRSAALRLVRRRANCTVFFRWRAPALRFLVTLCVAVERALEVGERDDEAGPAVDEAALENVEPDECPQAMSERTPHGGALARLRLRAEGGVEIGLVENLLQRPERKMPQHVLRPAGGPVARKLVVLVGERGRVAEHALAEELRRAVIAMPSGPADPPPHQVIVPRNVIGIVGRLASQQ